MKGATVALVLLLTCYMMASTIATSTDEEYSGILKEYKRYTRRARVKTCAAKKCEEKGEINDRRKEMCYCDDKCETFNDCCLDYWKSCNSTFPGLSTKKEIKYECLATNVKMPNTTKKTNAPTVGYYVVTKCPKDYGDLKTKQRCENLTVESQFVDGDDMVTYRNQYCAECHAVTTWKHWQYELLCPEDLGERLDKKLASGNHYFSKEERQELRDNCNSNMVPMNDDTAIKCTILKGCSNKASAHYNKCQLYNARFYELIPNKPPVKNPNCFLCNGGRRPNTLRLRPFGRRPTGGLSLAVLFDFSKAGEIYGLEVTKTKDVVKKCSSNEVYDFILKQCRSQRIAVNLTRNWTCAMENETFPNTTEYISMLENHTVYVPSHNKSYQPEMYHIDDYGNITVCGNFTGHFVVRQCLNGTNKSTTLYSDVEYYITLIGFTLSILALLVVLVTYGVFSELRTLPGKIVMNLAVALVLSQVVLLYDIVEDISGDACTVIAVILHYLYIAAFCWMNVMAYDVARTFAGKSHRSPSGSRTKVFLICLLYAWGLPALLVGITLAINHTGVLHVGYGNKYYCWITNPIALVVCFAAPVAVMLVFNIIALIRVLVAVRRVRKVTKKVRDTSSAGQDIGMCWKLTAVFGITWILGLGVGYHVVLRIIYIIFNSLQGVFIMVGFILTKRVLNLCLKKAGMKPLTTSGASSKGRSTTMTMVDKKKTNSVSSQRERQPLAPSKIQHQESVEPQNDHVNDETDCAEARLIDKMEGRETRL